MKFFHLPYLRYLTLAAISCFYIPIQSKDIPFDKILTCSLPSIATLSWSSQCGELAISSTNFKKYLSCYEDVGRNIMTSKGFQFYSGLCHCKLLHLAYEQFACASGAYSSWMNMRNSVPDSRSLYPCINAIEFPAACYRHLFSSRFYASPMRDALALCLGINDKDHRHSCVHGVGYAFSSKYYAIAGVPFPIDILCSVGNTADKIMCIHGYWDGLDLSEFELMELKNRVCITLSEVSLQEACLLRGIIDVPHDSPLFRSSGLATVGGPSYHNISQANTLILLGGDPIKVIHFREEVERSGIDLSIDVVKKSFSDIGILRMLYVVESSPKCGHGLVCHEQCHQLGRAVCEYTMSLEASIQACGTACHHGCFHGALSQWFSTEYAKVPSAEAGQLLRSYYKSLASDDSTAMRAYGIDLFHGLGHAIFESIAGSKIRAGLDECRYLPQHVWQIKCSVGVYMAHMQMNFTQSGLSPCDAFDSDFPAACFNILWPAKLSHHPNLTLQEGQSTCLAVRNNMDRHACFYGMGYAYSFFLWEHKKLLAIADICSRGDFDDQRMCVWGASNWPGPFAHNDTILTSMCNSLPYGPLQKSCFMKGYDKFAESNVPLFYYTAEMRQVDMSGLSSGVSISTAAPAANVTTSSTSARTFHRRRFLR